MAPSQKQTQNLQVLSNAKWSSKNPFAGSMLVSFGWCYSLFFGSKGNQPENRSPKACFGVAQLPGGTADSRCDRTGAKSHKAQHSLDNPFEYLRERGGVAKQIYVYCLFPKQRDIMEL